MISTKITRQVDEKLNSQNENNLPNGWTDGWQENNLPKETKLELNGPRES